jgi:hypothetical protein
MTTPDGSCRSRRESEALLLRSLTLPTGAIVHSVPTRTVLEWNGKDLPEQLRALPAGRYVLFPLDELVELSSEEEAGLLSALERAHAGVTFHADVMARAAEVLGG